VQSRLADATALLAALGAALSAADPASLGSPAVQAAALGLMGQLVQVSSALPPVEAALSRVTNSTAFSVGQWTHEDQGEVIALDMPFDAYALHQAFYGQAIVAALADCLNATAEAVVINAFQASSVDTALVYLSILLPGTSSSSSAVVVAEYASMQSLFWSGAPGAPAKPQLVWALQAFGLPVNAVFYGDQLPPPPNPSPPRPPRPPPPQPPPLPPFPPEARFRCGNHSTTPGAWATAHTVPKPAGSAWPSTSSDSVKLIVDGANNVVLFYACNCTAGWSGADCNAPPPPPPPPPPVRIGGRR